MRQTEERLDLINRLKTKYGQSVPEILDYAKEKQARIDILNDYDSYLEQLQRDYESSQKEFSRLAERFPGFGSSMREFSQKRSVLRSSI